MVEEQKVYAAELAAIEEMGRIVDVAQGALDNSCGYWKEAQQDTWHEASSRILKFIRMGSLTATRLRFIDNYLKDMLKQLWLLDCQVNSGIYHNNGNPH